CLKRGHKKLTKLMITNGLKNCESIKTEDIWSMIKLLFLRFPATIDLPLFIIKHEDATLEELEMEKVTVIDNLLKKKKRREELYWNIVGLKEKVSEFGDPNPKVTYLRFTLGEDKGNSPGFPYVLKI
ncbi:19709_t:CDS:2, partial [Gigaspora margarita]